MNSRVLDLQRRWAAPDGLDRSRPRPVAPNAKGKGVLAGALVLFAAGLAAAIGLGGVAARHVRESRQFEREGVVQQGMVTRIGRPRGDARQASISYRFEAMGRSYAGAANVPVRYWSGLRAGAPIFVRYIPSNPRLNYPAGLKKAGIPIWLPFLVASQFALIALVLMLLLRRERRLLSEGRAAPGLVTGYREIRRGMHQSDLGRAYYYDFALLSGAVMKGHSRPGRSLPAIGSEICVLYDPDHPKRNAPYPLQLVRLTLPGLRRRPKN